MALFRSQVRNLDLQLPNKRVVEFRDYSFTTYDEAVAELIRKLPNFNRDIWDTSVVPKVTLDPVTLEHIEPTPEIPAEEVKIEVPKRRGRPPRVVGVVQGIRSSDVIENKEKQE